jgi:hypothetical protein
MDSIADPTESESLDPELVAESTEPHYAPERRPTPVPPPPAEPPNQAQERSRRPTLVSPIPALMAASMRMQGPAADGISGASLAAEAIPLAAEPQMTSKLGEHSRAVLLQGESDYVVEIEDTKTDFEPPSGSAVPIERDIEDTDNDL